MEKSASRGELQSFHSLRHMNNILPAIFEQDFVQIEKRLDLVKPFAKAIHIDLLDGKFAKNTSFSDPQAFMKYKGEFFFELHMMVEEPESYLEVWSKAGIGRFIGHIEKMNDQASFVSRAQNLGEVGLALDAHTSSEEVKVPLEDLDSLLIMTVKAGLSGQQFMPECLEKVRYFAPTGIVPVEVDGGISLQTLPDAVKAGAKRAAVTSALFWHGEAEDNFHDLQKLFNEPVE